jgi:hypothetical protein
MKKTFDYREFEKLLANLKDLQKQHEVFIRNFLVEMGMRAIAQTKKLTPVDTGNLRNNWELSQVYRKRDELYIVLFNPTEYASFIEDGHMQYSRWVPGEWRGDKFEYIPGAKTGMMLKEKWIPGHHMARISITKVERELPARYDRAFKEFVKGLGAV